jgi:hypothetical protein
VERFGRTDGHGAPRDGTPPAQLMALNQTLKASLRDLEAAFRGPRRARAKLKQYRSRAHRLETGLAAISARWPALCSDSTDDPIFILSAGWRSGSTMLQRLLMARGQHIIWGEPFSHAQMIDAIAEPIRCFTETWPHDAWFADAASATELSRRWVANLYPPLENLLRSHLDLFQRLFADPARRLGAVGWGIKDVRLTTDHALYLRWLFPRARFIFLYRNPYAAYRSYRPYRRWYLRWPDQPVFTPWAFGKVWKALTDDFMSGHGKVNGMLVKYEDLVGPQPPLEALSQYVGFEVPHPRDIDRIADKTSPPRESRLPLLEAALLRAAVDPTASRLGYRPD